MSSPELSEEPDELSLDHYHRGHEVARQALLLSLGLYDASEDEYDTPEHTDSYWKSVN